MLLSLSAVIIGLILLVWSADYFIDGAAATARHLGMPPLLVGMVIVGFGTSAPEMVVSVLAALENSPGIALGNAYGSNITNITLILGLTALISPLVVQRNIVKIEMPILLAISVLASGLVYTGHLGRIDGAILLGVLLAYCTFTVRAALKDKNTHASEETLPEETPLKKGIFYLVAGLVVLVLSSRLLVWGAVNIAQAMGVSDLVIGLTVIAVGTSLPELASSIAATRKGEHDIALGNVVGSNLFNTLAVVGLAALIRPLDVPPEVMSRDVPIMMALTILLMVFCLRKRIGHAQGAFLLATFIAYTTYLAVSAFG